MPIAAEIYYHLYSKNHKAVRPPIVLIHGAGGTHLFWPPAIRRLSGYQVYALDLPGHGKSYGRGLQSISAYSAVVLKWMAAIGIHRAVFIGHSMGSAISLLLALDHPEQVSALALFGGGARLQVSQILLDSTSNPTTFNNAVAKIVQWSFSPNSSPRLKELASQRMAETRPSVLHGDFLACNEFNESGRIANISQPTLVLCGLEDKMTPPHYSKLLANNIPNAHLEIVPDAGHMVMLEQPQLVAGAIEEFLSTSKH